MRTGTKQILFWTGAAILSVALAQSAQAQMDYRNAEVFNFYAQGIEQMRNEKPEEAAPEQCDCVSRAVAALKTNEIRQGLKPTNNENAEKPKGQGK